MPRYIAPRMRLRDVLTHNKATLDGYAAMAGQEIKPLVTPMPKQLAKRVSTGRTEPRERVNLAAIIQLLRTHPKVAFAWRMQSGLFQEGARFIKVGVTGIPDIIGSLCNGQFYGIEVKAKGGTISPMQQKRIEQITEAGGLAFVAWSVDDVIEQLATVDTSQWPNQR
jgi:hypothetical protein